MEDHPDYARSKCGQCIGCKLEYSRMWAIRGIHESTLHKSSCYLTLTYDDEHLPWGYTLVKDHFPAFMKRLRADRDYEARKATKKLGTKVVPDRLAFLMAGEYGEKYGRPHYHAILWGEDFPDKKFFKVHHGNNLYTSARLEKLWPHGYSTIGAVTFDSLAYVARYVTKKLTGPKAEEHYAWYEQDGEHKQQLPEYSGMSLRPAIGKGWYEKWKAQVYRDDTVIIRGRPMRPPPYYDGLYEVENPNHFANLKEKRIEKMKTKKDQDPLARLAAGEEIAKAKERRHRQSRSL